MAVRGAAHARPRGSNQLKFTEFQKRFVHSFALYCPGPKRGEIRMTTYDLWMTRFGDYSPIKQVAIMVGMAVVSADLLAAFFFLAIGLDRLVTVLVVTTFIVVLVSVPLGAFLIGLNFRLKQIAIERDLAARMDDLTGLANRNEFYLRAERQILLSRPGTSAGALLYIDADYFKAINDRHGHATGDTVLREIAVSIRAAIGKDDLASRFGGEEFAVFLKDADFGRADWLAQKVLNSVRNIADKLRIDELDVTVSVGIALHEPGQSLEAALNAADRCLYAAKNQGRNRIVHASDDAERYNAPVQRY